MKNHRVVLGVDIGGTRSKIGLVDQDGKYLAHSSFPTKAKDDYNSFLIRLFNHSEELQKKFNGPLDIRAIGIGVPNANSNLGIIENPPNFNWGPSVPLVEGVSGKFGLPVVITNDANAAALGEYKFGIGKAQDNPVAN